MPIRPNRSFTFLRARPTQFLLFLCIMCAGLTACGTQEPPVEQMPSREVVETVAARTGAWIDTLVAVEEPNADAAVSRLETGDIDVYVGGSSAQTYRRIQDSESISHKTFFGGVNELTFNPAACGDETQLNPFSVPQIREAMNWLVDRNYIVAEILRGLGKPQYVPINAASADRGRLATEIQIIEAQYAYDAERARAVTTAQMESLGAKLVNEKWTFGGAPVELTGIIRSEDERTQVGDYFANQLEDLGFTVVRDYRTTAESSPIVNGEPTECRFHFYTGGWISSQVRRNADSAFSFFYTPVGLPGPLWQAYTPTEEFAGLAQRLRDSDYSSLEERKELFAQVMPLALQNSVRIWLYSRTSIGPYRRDIKVSADLAGGILASRLWPYTLRFKDRIGGSLTWASPSILSEAWNPVAGTNWIYDATLIRAVGQSAFVPDPNTGLLWPHQVNTLQVTAKEGLPVNRTLDWLSLDFAQEIVVPGDTWVDWDAARQRFLTAAEVDTKPRTALVKVIATYPEDLFDTTRWHDANPLGLADIIMSFIVFLDKAKPDSPIYDKAQVPAVEAFLSTFKGLRITSTDPLVIEFYSDAWKLDAENTVGNLLFLWPSYTHGEAPWHTVGLGILAEQKGLAVFSSHKAAAQEVEQLNYIAGPTVEVLSQQLSEAADREWVPYAATMSEYMTPEVVTQRYANLKRFFDRHGHFWVGTGPFYLDRAYPVERTVVLVRNPDYPEAADRWLRFSEPAIAEIDVDGPVRVAPGEAAGFDISVSFENKPYAGSDIQEVKYLVFDATGQLAVTGAAAAVEDGQWRVDLPGEVTAALVGGANRLEVIVVSRLVAIPSQVAYQFVTLP